VLRTSVRPAAILTPGSPVKLRLKQGIETEITLVCDVGHGAGRHRRNSYFLSAVWSLLEADVSLLAVVSLLGASPLLSEVDEATEPLPFEEAAPDGFLA
jgi:hypothetical protein